VPPKPESAPEPGKTAPLPILDPETQALVSFGFFRKVDGVMLAGWTLYTIPLVYWWVFTDPTAIRLMTAFFGLLLWSSAWVILLLFRVCRFIVEIRASISLLPDDVALHLSNRLTSVNGEAGRV
jgi:hypothetical protein